MRTNPHILEINAHNWLKQIKADLKQENITLADVPEQDLFEMKAHGFDALWLMGVWKESPASRAIAREDKAINDYLSKAAPGYDKADIVGSQYAIYDYTVNEAFGGNEALLKLKKRLNDFGIKLILDFAGNHLSKDNPLTLTDKDVFVFSDEEPKAKELFFQTRNGYWLAHGKDPYFPSWTDTVQINHFNPKARKFLKDTLLKIVPLCDGLRCDMVMLMLNKVFRDTWGNFVKDEMPAEEFWPQVISEVKSEYPRFTFLAEVYWGLEWEVQELGFDYTYDKTLYDRLRLSTAQDIQGHLNAEHLYQKRSLRFIANHDEEAPLLAFGREKSKAAAAAAYTLIGARLFTMSQIYGEEKRLPIQYTHRFAQVDQEIYDFYKNFLDIINHPCFHGGQWTIKNPKPANEEDLSFKNILCWAWTQQNTQKIVIINYSDVPSSCIMPVDKVPSAENLILKEHFKQNETVLPSAQAKKDGVLLQFQPFETKIFSVDF